MANLNEKEINRADVNAVFNIASDMRENPSGPSKYFKSLRKDKIDVGDLQKAWQEAGYPDDIRDIESILANHGYSKKEINKVFAGAFGSAGKNSYNEPEASPVIQQIADYAKQQGLDKDLIAFMQKEYGFKESHEFEGKAVIEDVRKIFTSIVHEERTDRHKLIRNEEQRILGRNRK